VDLRDETLEFGVALPNDPRLAGVMGKFVERGCEVRHDQVLVELEEMSLLSEDDETGKLLLRTWLLFCLAERVVTVGCYTIICF